MMDTKDDNICIDLTGTRSKALVREDIKEIAREKDMEVKNNIVCGTDDQVRNLVNQMQMKAQELSLASNDIIDVRPSLGLEGVLVKKRHK